jgi:hypothetical protein
MKKSLYAIYTMKVLTEKERKKKGIDNTTRWDGLQQDCPYLEGKALYAALEAAQASGRDVRHVVRFTP